MDKIHYEKLLEKRRQWYKTVKKVYCPCLGVDVFFNSKGFRHILYDGEGKLRSLQDRIRRLNLLPLAISMIGNSTKIHEHRTQWNMNSVSFRKYHSNRGTWITVVIKINPLGKMNFVSVIDRK